MPQFKYRAKEGEGKTVEGVIEAVTEDDAIEKVSQLGYLPVRVVEVNSSVVGEPASTSVATPTVKPSVAPQSKLAIKGIKSREITAFGRQLSSLIRAGVPILNAIGVISEQSENPSFKSLLQRVYEEVKNGATLSSSLSQFPRLFPPLYISLVSAGESSGNLDQTIARITDYRQKQEEIFSRVRSAMIYPILMALTGIGTIVFMLAFVMPRLIGVFENLGGNLPLPTRILIQTSQLVRTPWVWGIVLVVTALILLSFRKKDVKANTAFSGFVLHVPIFGPLTLKAEIARFTRTLELLIKGGIPVIQAIQTAAPVVSNTILRNELIKCIQEIREGGSFGKGLKKSKRFPTFMTNLIAVGEESGKLDEALSEIANFYERETDEAIRIMTSLLEPLMILSMGLVVGFIVIAMLLPMFELNMMVR